jgi:alpha-galactosidase
MHEVGCVTVDGESAMVYEHGWQSWSPSGCYPLGTRPQRPSTENSRVMNWRQEKQPAAEAFWGEGLMAIDPGDGSGIAIFAAAPAADPAPSIRADVHGSEVVVSADGPVVQTTDTRASSISDALGHWAGWYASAVGVALRRRTPTAWCSWYHYLAHVNHDDILENLAAMDRLGLDVDVVQIDDGYQAQIGDWLSVSDRFGSLQAVVADIRQSGRRAGMGCAVSGQPSVTYLSPVPGMAARPGRRGRELAGGTGSP